MSEVWLKVNCPAPALGFEATEIPEFIFSMPDEFANSACNIAAHPHDTLVSAGEFFHDIQSLS